MRRYVAFLRGMNIGGRRIKNDDLRTHVAGLGFSGVTTFRASGNVIFEAGDGGGTAEISTRLEGGLAEALEYEVPVFLRTEEEVLAIAAKEPFGASLVAASAGKLQVAFLLEEPSATVSEKVLTLATDEDRLAIHARELYWLPSGGISESELDLNAIGATLGLTTLRTKGTIDQIAAKHLSG
jgi:uncharacterized protein (DUF1697 family)